MVGGSRIGRTLTAPADDDPRPVSFAFVSCQDANVGAQNAYRRMLYEDRRAAPEHRLGFVLHLGDFIYEVVEYPDEVKTRYDRTIYEVARIPDGGKSGKLHYPLTVDGYRAVYKGYLADPDLHRLSHGDWPDLPGVAGQARWGRGAHPAAQRLFGLKDVERDRVN
jgi:alkaline phosphatase D